MSSNYHRISRVYRRIIRRIYGQYGYLAVIVRIERRHAAINDRRHVSGRLGSRVGGGTSERHDTAALTEAGLLHPNPDAVLAPLFTGGSGFFWPPTRCR